MEQNNRKMQKQRLGWTSMKQSQELVKAGLNPETADMYIPQEDTTPKVIQLSLKEHHAYYPCWSLGALIDIIPDSIKKGDVSFQFHSTFNIVDRFAACYEDSSYNRQIMCKAWNNPIELYVHIIVWLLEECFIEKQK